MKKKAYILSAVGLLIMLPALAALNMFVVSFPEWVMLIPAVLLAAVNVLLIVRTDVRLWAKIVLPVLSVLMIAAGLLGSYCNPYWSSVTFRDTESTRSYDTVLTYREAEADMDQMMAIVSKCHPMFVDSCPDEFAAAYDSAIERLKNDDEITVNDLRCEIQRTLSVLGDGHTNAYPDYDDQRYLKTIAGRKAEGWTLYSVNGYTPKRLFETRRDLFCYEAESWGVLSLRNNLSSLSGLDFLGIDPEGVMFTWMNEEGEFVTDTYTAADFLPMDEYLEYNAQYSTEDQPREQFVWYDYETEVYSVALLSLTECRYDDEYKKYLQLLFSDVKEHGIRNVVVDLRGNGGGNSMVANEFIRYLPVDTYKVDGCYHRLGCFMLDYTGEEYIKLNNEKYTDLTFEGNVYLLTDSSSFSSAMLFAAYIKDNGLGTIIGEPPGNEPNGYGEVVNFRLGNSGLYISVSTKQFIRPDQECTDELVMPDIPCSGDETLDVLVDMLSDE